MIEDNFFIIDSFNLANIKSHFFGFCVTEKGILTNNYYKEQGYHVEYESQGVYILIKRIANKLKIYQDYYGNFGIYFYENKEKRYFAISNSFLLLLEHLIKKQHLTLNKDFADNFIITGLYSPSIYETMVKEITKLPTDIIIIINIKKKNINLVHLKNDISVPFESKKGLEIIDKWVDKWCYIIRSLKKKTKNISADLSGGFDTRLLLAILLNSNINLNEILIRSIDNNISCHKEDFIIAKNISTKFGFKINNFIQDKREIKWNIKDSLFLYFYTKLGFHKSWSFHNTFYCQPRFAFTGGGGEIIRGYPELSIQEYIKKLTINSWKVKGHEHEFFNSSSRLFNRSI